MSDGIDLKAHLTADDDASPVIRALIKNVQRLQKLTHAANDPAKLYGKLIGAAAIAGKSAEAQAAASKAGLAYDRARLALGADLRQRMSFENRMQRQRLGEERRSQREAVSAIKSEKAARLKLSRISIAEAARAQRQRYADLQRRLAFQDRMARQRAGEAREIERQDRLRERLHRREMARIDREGKARKRAFSNTGRTAAGSLRDASNKVAIAGLTGAAAAGYAGRSIVQNEAETDAAEKNARIYGGLSADQARKLRDEWAGPIGVQLGASTAQMLTGYTDALKAGIPESAAKDVASLGVKLAEAWGLTLDEVNGVLGNVKAIQTSDGSAFKFGNLKAWANTTQLLAAKLSTTPEALLQYQRQAAGGAALLGMSQQASLAFGAASTTLGNRPGESGSALDYLASRVAAMPQLTRQDGIEGNRARKLMRSLGYGSAAGMEKARKADPDQFVFDLLERLNKLKGPKRNEAILALAGTEWLGEIGRMVTGIDTVREARQIQRSANGIDAIGEMWGVHTTKLQFVGRQASAALSVLLGEVGKTLGPMVADAGRYFVNWSQRNKKSLRVNFWAAMQGLTEGFLGREGNFKDLLKKALNGVGLSSDPQKIYEFFKGVAKGLKEIWDVLSWIFQAAKSFILGLGEMLGVGTNDPEAMGKSAARIVGGVIGAKLLETPVSVAKDAAVGTAAGVWTAGTIASALGFGGAGAVAAPLAIGAGAMIGISNWDEFRDIWKGQFGEPGWTTRRRENDARRARGENPDPIDRFLNNWLGGAFGRRTPTGKRTGSISGTRYASLGNSMTDFSFSGGSGGKPMLDAIARAEGTAGRGDYDAVLGFGKFGSPSKPLTQMTLNEVDAFSRQMRSHPANRFNSSAVGRYQILGNSTMRDAARALGMDPATTKFDAATQDRMAEWIAQKQGLGAWEGFKRNPAELATARAAIAGAPTISTAGTALAANNVRYANAAGIRNKRITDNLQRNLSEAVLAAYGPGYTAEIYSGGQDAKGHGHRRTGSTRHDNGSAADVYIYGPDGKRLRGNQLGPIAQEWLAKQRGGVGLEMNGGGIHLDEHKNRAKTWTYGPLTPGQRAAVSAGLAGNVPQNMTPTAGSIAAAQKPTVSALAGSVPLPTPAPANRFGGTAAGNAMGGMGGGGPVTININGANQSPEQIATAVERRMQERSRFLTHDVEYDT